MGQHASLQHPTISINHKELNDKLNYIAKAFSLKEQWWLTMVDDMAAKRRELLWELIKLDNDLLDKDCKMLVKRLQTENSKCKLVSDDDKKLAEVLYDNLDWSQDEKNGRLEYEIIGYILLAHAQHMGVRNFDHKKLDEWEACLAKEELGMSLGVLDSMDDDDDEEDSP